MDLNELQNEVDRDLKIDDTELDLESIRTPQLHNKYLKHYTKYSLQYKKARDEYKSLYKFKWEYYTGKSDPEVYQSQPFDLKILKSDINIYLLRSPILAIPEAKKNAVASLLFSKLI